MTSQEQARLDDARAQAQTVELCAIFDDRQGTANPRILATVCAIIASLRDQATRNMLAINLCEYLHERHSLPFCEATILQMCGFDATACRCGEAERAESESDPRFADDYATVS
jgi:hypothetical protein